MAIKTRLNVSALPGRAYGTFLARAEIVITLVADRRVFTMDTVRRVFTKDTVRRIFKTD